MATADEYAAWIVKNADKKGTPEFETVAEAYKLAKATPQAAPAPAAPPAGGSMLADGVKGFAAGAGTGLGKLVLGAQRFAGKGLAALDDDPKSMVGRAGKWLVDDADAGKARLDAENAPYKAASPIANGAGEIGGSIVATLPVGGLLPNALRAAAGARGVVGIMPRTAQAAGIGAVYGGVTGTAGSSADTVGGMLTDGARGAGAGAVFGIAATPTAAVLGAVGSNVAQRFNKSRAAGHAKLKVAEAIARDAEGEFFTSGAGNPLIQAAKRFSNLGDEAVLADAGGKSTRELLDTLAILPGRTKNAVEKLLHKRTAGVSHRLRAAAEDAFDTQGQRLPTTIDSLIARRERDSAPLYAQLRTIDVVPSPELAKTIASAEALGATKLARDIATARQMPFTLDAAAPNKWNMGDLDHVKQAVDDLLMKPSATSEGKLTSLGASLEVLRKTLVKQLDQATTNTQTGQSLYRKARAAFEAPSALVDAGNAGRAAINHNETKILAKLKGMSQNEQQAFRIGAFEGLREKLGNQGGATEVMNMWKNPSMQEKLRAIFGTDRAYRKFAANVYKEIELKELQSVGRGSQTAARHAGMGDLDMTVANDVGQAAAALKTGNVLSGIGSLRSAWSRVATPQSVRDEMGNMLLARGGAGARNLNSIEALVESINRRNMLLSNNIGVLGGQVGGRVAVPAQLK